MFFPLFVQVPLPPPVQWQRHAYMLQVEHIIRCSPQGSHCQCCCLFYLCHCHFHSTVAATTTSTGNNSIIIISPSHRRTRSLTLIVCPTVDNPGPVTSTQDQLRRLVSNRRPVTNRTYINIIITTTTTSSQTHTHTLHSLSHHLVLLTPPPTPSPPPPPTVSVHFSTVSNQTPQKNKFIAISSRLFACFHTKHTNPYWAQSSVVLLPPPPPVLSRVRVTIRIFRFSSHFLPPLLPSPKVGPELRSFPAALVLCVCVCEWVSECLSWFHCTKFAILRIPPPLHSSSFPSPLTVCCVYVHCLLVRRVAAIFPLDTITFVCFNALSPPCSVSPCVTHRLFFSRYCSSC